MRAALDEGTVPQATRALCGDGGLAAAMAAGADMLAKFTWIMQPFVAHREWASG